MEFTSYDVRWQATAGGSVQVYVAQAPREKLDDLLRQAIGVEDLDKVPFLEVWGNHTSGNVHVIRDGHPRLRQRHAVAVDERAQRGEEQACASGEGSKASKAKAPC